MGDVAMQELSAAMNVQSGRKYCLTPINMVPNGPPHLGHVSGPFLRMDILRRYLISRGGMATFITTTDVHETHVVIKASELQITPEEVANHFHEQISRDLASLDICYDALINPLDPEWAPVYTDITHRLMNALSIAGTSKLLEERLPVRRDNGSYVLGGWLAGECPHCGIALVSFFCENCGDQTTPSKLLNPHHRIDNVLLDWTDSRSLFLVLPDASSINDQLDRMGIRRDFREIADRYLAQYGPVFRLSLPDKWGERCTGNGLPEGHVTFSYSSALVAAQILSGEVYKRHTNSRKNPFEAGSDVTIVSSFGIDNAVPMLIGVIGTGVGQIEFRPPDFYLMNYFYTLGEQKFSTNRQHAIWAADICEKTEIPSDLFRAYMVRANPEFRMNDFDVGDFINASNSLVDKIGTSINRSIESIESGCVNPLMPLDISSRLKKALIRQDMAMDLRDFCLSDLISPIDAWIVCSPALCGQNASASYWWLKGLAILSYPVMPRLGSWIWRRLGHYGTPAGADFIQVPPMNRDAGDYPLANRVSWQSLAHILPASMRAAQK